VPDTITPVSLPAYYPELNPVERVWLHLKERFFSHRLHPDYDAIVDAACDAREIVMDEDAHASGRGGQHASVRVGLVMWAIALAVLWLV
jgi:hypothetical protein